MNFKRKGCKNKGITLIALVITIITLLILAGVTINAITGNENVMGKAQEARSKTEIETEREAIQIEYVSKKLENQYEDLESEVIGKELNNNGIYDGEKYHVIRVEDESGNITEYGTGYEYIEKGTVVNGIEMKYPWILNQKTGEAIEIKEENKTEVNGSAGVAVVGEDLRLNLDAVSLNSNSWSNGVKVHEDVKYDDTEKCLKFNESSTNQSGEGGYIELQKAGDFSNGFTFEMYMNLSRILYNNKKVANNFSGLFCKMPSLSSTCTLSMRFGYTHDNAICKFCWNSSYCDNDFNLGVVNGGVYTLNDNPGYKVGEDTYLTFVYKVYDEEKVKTDEEWKTKSKDKKVDKIEYYINGKLYGYTYYGSDSYEAGCKIWNNDSCPLFIGVCPWSGDNCLYYLKGKVYATRLYTRDLTKDEVKANYDAAINSRKDLNKK